MSEIDDYYKLAYSSSQKSGLQGFGGGLADGSLLRELESHKSDSVLELGAGSGEFTIKAIDRLNFENYTATDLSPGRANGELAEAVALKASKKGKFSFQQADAHSLPFESESFDLVFSTCLLAHVTSPEKVIDESLRVVKKGGAVVFMLPTDPGIINQLIKTLWTYPSLKKNGIKNPKYLYALEHKNPIHNLLAILQHSALGKPALMRFRPFFFPSWNFNLWVVSVLRKNS
jgi:ubiquinone/menaquinone biosynthesis C-methylase UbiE